MAVRFNHLLSITAEHDDTVHVFPTATSVGVPEDWEPDDILTGPPGSYYDIVEDDTVVEDIRFEQAVLVRAANVTLRRVEVIDSYVSNYIGGATAYGDNMLIEDSTIRETNPGAAGGPVLSHGSYTARRVLIDNVGEGLRVADASGSGPVVIENCFVRAHYPTPCIEWHGDALQGFNGGPVTIRDSVLILVNTLECGGTAPFFWPAGNSSVDIDGLICEGGGAPFQCSSVGTVRNLHIIEDSWIFFPTVVNCDLFSYWGAYISNYDDDGQPVIVESLPCGGLG